MRTTTWGSWGVHDQSLAASSVPAGLTGMFVLNGAGAPVDGVTGVGVLQPGYFYRNTTNGQYYTNVGTLVATVFQLMLQG